MERLLDLGCGDGYFMLKDAMAHPERRYIGIDNRRQSFCTNTPEGVYNLLKNIALTYAHNMRNPPNEPGASLWLCDKIILGYDRNKDYHEFLMLLIPQINIHKRGKRILESIVGEVVEHRGNPFFKLYQETGFIESTMMDFLISHMPEHFGRLVSQYSDRIRFVRADVKRLPFYSKTFDHVRAAHLPVEEDQYAQEAERVATQHEKILVI